MDAEFVEYLDGKFRHIDAQFIDVKESIRDVQESQRHLTESLDTLTQNVDHFVHLHEQLDMEQVSIRADLTRIKSVIKEKLGVDI